MEPTTDTVERDPRMRTVTPDEFLATLDKVDKINARAIKRGFTGRLTVDSIEREVTSRNALGFEITETVYDVLITGEAPKYGDGWTVAAVATWDAEAGLILRTAPGVPKLDRAPLRKGWCDHCKLNRHRNDTYVLIHTDGRQVQVGSTCIKDFLGWHAMPVFLSADDVTDEVDSFLAGGAWERRYSVETIFAVAWAAVQAFGYVRAGAYDGTPTKTVVMIALDPIPGNKADRALVEKLRPYVEQASAQAKIIRDWILSDAFSGDNEFVINLKAAAGVSTASTRNIGILAYAPEAWARGVERELAKRAKDEADKSVRDEWWGQPGDKFDGIKVTVESIRYWEGDHGTVTIYNMISADGYRFSWWASRSAMGSETDGRVWTIKGTVKAHKTYRGAKETQVTRVKAS